jgi:DNA polymerase III subunit chi
MKIDFYILNQSEQQKVGLFVCHLLEKIYVEQPIYIHTSSKDAAENFDHLLWIYRDDSFLPHEIYAENQVDPALIQIGHGPTIPNKNKDILINLQHDFLDFYQQFNHLIEIVSADAHVQQCARERYKQYREQGHTLNTYKENTP